MRRRSRVVGARTIALVGIILLVLTFPSLPGVAGHSDGWVAVAHTPPFVPDVSSVYAGSFAARAGYNSADSFTVSAIAPASGSELVAVTFRPSDPSFFTPPPVGATPLSVSQIADRYGLSPLAYASAQSYFESEGLSIVHASPDRLTLTVGGTASAIGRAFGTALESGTYSGRAVTFPAVPPSLPADLEPLVSAVTGLSSGFTSFSLPAGLPAPGTSSTKRPAISSNDLVSPAIARQVYDVSALYNVTGAAHYAVGQGIVLLLWGWGYAPSDLATFFSSNYPASFPQPAFQATPVDGAPAPSANAVNDPSKAPQELTLDMEWAGSMAPGATLHAVYAPDGPASDNYSPTDVTMADALHMAVTGISGVSVISMSFGTPESASGALAAAWATDFATAAQEGITLLAATGDFGGDAGASCSGGVSSEFPATSPDVLAVGGTAPTLARNLLGQVTGLASEPAWSGSGGGFSSVYPAPAWQEVGSAAAPIAQSGHRGIPDVSAASAYNFLYYNGQSGVAAGTSFATPLWAGLVTEMDAQYGARLGFVTPRLYAVAASQEQGGVPIGLADVTGGTTCIGTAVAGWDTETGWGSPRALLFYEDLTATFVGLSISASPTLVAPGGTVTVTARLTNRSSGAAIVGIPVTVSLRASDSNGPCAGGWGSQSILSNSSGFVSLAVAIPVCFLGAHADALASVTSGGYYGTNSTTVDVNLLGFAPALAGIETFPGNVIAFVVIMGAASTIGFVLGQGRRRTLAQHPAVSPPPPPRSPPVPVGAYQTPASTLPPPPSGPPTSARPPHPPSG